MIGGNVLLGEAILESGATLDIWSVPSMQLTEALQELVQRTAAATVLLASPPELETRYDVIVAPFVLECVDFDVTAVLTSLAQLLDPDGKLLVVTANPTGLQNLVAALQGRNPARSRPSAEASTVSWPSEDRVRTLYASDVISGASRAGLSIAS